ncbi:MAG: hypothetical protein P8Z30_16800, partial [Acidobacteriota bacterium]
TFHPVVGGTTQCRDGRLKFQMSATALKEQSLRESGKWLTAGAAWGYVLGLAFTLPSLRPQRRRL